MSWRQPQCSAWLKMHSPMRQDSTRTQPRCMGQLRHPLQLRAGRLLGQGQAGHALHWDSSGMITPRQCWHLRSRHKRSGITGGSLTCQPLGARPCAYCSMAVSSQGNACVLGRDSPRRCFQLPRCRSRSRDLQYCCRSIDPPQHCSARRGDWGCHT